jgi:hypothetical protein
MHNIVHIVVELINSSMLPIYLMKQSGKPGWIESSKPLCRTQNQAKWCTHHLSIEGWWLHSSVDEQQRPPLLTATYSNKRINVYHTRTVPRIKG